MLVDTQNRFLTIREYPKMTRLQPELGEKGIRIISLDTELAPLLIPIPLPPSKLEKVVIWNADVTAESFSEDIDLWFSQALGTSVKLVHMPKGSRRPVDTTSGYHPAGKFVSFADAYPFMMMGETSLSDLNQRYAGDTTFDFDRFRPNIVFSGGYPNQEDEIERFSINGVAFQGLENCARCTVPNVDPKTGIIDESTEPLATLSTYRLQNRKVNFGRNLVHSGTGTVRVGDFLEM